MSALPQNSDAASVVEALVDGGALDDAAARRAMQAARVASKSVVAVINQLALADDARVLAILAERFGLAVAASQDVPAAPVEVASISPSFLRRHRVLPLGWSNGRLIVGVIDPSQSHGLAALSFAAKCAAEPRLMSASDQRRAFDALYGAGADAPIAQEAATPATAWVEDAARMRDHSDSGPAVRVVESILERALEAGASDIHIEPLADRVRVRFRIDGALSTVREEPAELGAPIAARIKILADMDVADRRSAQDGRTSLAAKGRPVDVRISTVPSAFGETVALRLLRRDPALLNLPGLGFAPDMLAIFERVLSARRGLFLLTGPTGSGKTTTLYAMIERLRNQALKILSIEDPIEYFFNDVTQVQVNEDAGLTFASALRSFLRQDPDVILVGEIRDSETARIAVQAALTGHLVLATLHTSDAPGAAARLADMGVDRYLIAATVIGVVSQRLVRRLCPGCRAPRAPSAAEMALLPLAADALVSDAVGCPACRETAYAGRLAVAEGFLLDDCVREAIVDANVSRLGALLAERGFAPVAVAAARLAARAEISLADARALVMA